MMMDFSDARAKQARERIRQERDRDTAYGGSRAKVPAANGEGYTRAIVDLEQTLPATVVEAE